MTVSELIEKLKQMPQDAEVNLGLESAGQTGENLVVTLERSGVTTSTDYVFIGDY